MLQLQVRELPSLATSTTAAGHGALQLLDVREGWEIERARLHLDGTDSLEIPMHEVPARLADIDRTRPVVVICHHGARSAQVVAYLLRQGLQQVYNLSGGIDAWSVEVDPRVPRY